MHFLEKYTIPP